jgi:hypothetical protein
MNEPVKKSPQRARRHSCQPLHAGTSSPARRQAAVILEVLAGMRRPSDAAQALGISVPRYYQVERRALMGLIAACEPAPRGPRREHARRIAALEREKLRLQRECDRQQALVRATQRSLGLAPPAAVRPAKDPPGKKESGPAKRRRNRRPMVRALQAARSLQAETAAAVLVPETSTLVAEPVLRWPARSTPSSA